MTEGVKKVSYRFFGREEYIHILDTRLVVASIASVQQSSTEPTNAVTTLILPIFAYIRLLCAPSSQRMSILPRTQMARHCPHDHPSSADLKAKNQCMRVRIDLHGHPSLTQDKKRPNISGLASSSWGQSGSAALTRISSYFACVMDMHGQLPSRTSSHAVQADRRCSNIFEQGCIQDGERRMDTRAALAYYAVAALAMVSCSSTTPLLQCCEDPLYRAPEHRMLTTYSVLYVKSIYSSCRQMDRRKG